MTTLFSWRGQPIPEGSPPPVLCVSEGTHITSHLSHQRTQKTSNTGTIIGGAPGTPGSCKATGPPSERAIFNKIFWSAAVLDCQRGSFISPASYLREPRCESDICAKTLQSLTWQFRSFILCAFITDLMFCSHPLRSVRQRSCFVFLFCSPNVHVSSQRQWSARFSHQQKGVGRQPSNSRNQGPQT